jgi:hypothetical protein
LEGGVHTGKQACSGKFTTYLLSDLPRSRKNIRNWANPKTEVLGLAQWGILILFLDFFGLAAVFSFIPVIAHILFLV